MFWWQCVLSVGAMFVQAVMAEPVIAADGHTYEKRAMLDWLQHCNKSPATGQRLPHFHLVDNTVIKSLIQQQGLLPPRQHKL